MHIFKRNNTYYYKLVIPKDLQKLLPLKRIRFSLHTKCKMKAITLASSYTSKYYTLFFQLRSGIFTEAEMNTLIKHGLYLNVSHISLNKVNKNLPITHTLQELSAMYSNDKIITNAWTTKTLKTYQFVFKVFSKVVNVKAEVNNITRAELQTFKATLIQLPPMKQSYMGLTINQIFELNLHPLANATAQKYLGYIVSLFKWCELEGYVNKSVASGLNIKDDKNKGIGRVPYSIDDLNVLFTQSTLYTKDLNMSLLEHPERIFLPLISMYQGMRLNEIAQLYTKDIRIIDGVYCIDINVNSDDKRLKNKSSARVIPIHNELIELGLIEYVKRQKKLNKVRLWSELTLGLEGYGTNFRKWYGVYNRKCITTDRTKTFHSFRHLFTHTLKQISLSYNIDHFALKYILGHSSSSDVTIDVYTHGYNIKDLAEVINKLKYDGLEIEDTKSQLKYNANFKKKQVKMLQIINKL